MQEAIEQGAKYLHVFNLGQRVTINNAGTQLCVRFKIVLDNVPRKRQANERALVFLKRLTELGDDAPSPNRVLFSESQLAATAVYRQIFGDTELCFEQPICGLEIDAAAMQAAQLRSNRHIRSMAIAFLERSTVTRERPVSARVSEIVHRLLATGELTVDLVAESLNLNRRTLQRRLDAEGMRFVTIVEAVRRERAERYLAESRMPLSQVAALLGYTEQSAFNRACRRWFDTTPRRYRERLLE